MLELWSHIVARHHGKLREAFVRIEVLFNAVVSAHGDDHHELRDLQRAFGQLREELEPHLHSEAELLFSACTALERQGRPVEEALLVAHERNDASVRNGLLALRVLADDYDPRRAVCATHGMLLDALAAFELDLRRHTDEENNVLFPHVRRVRRDIKSQALPRCCRAWIGEHARGWAHGRLKSDREDGAPVQPSGRDAR